MSYRLSSSPSRGPRPQSDPDAGSPHASHQTSTLRLHPHHSPRRNPQSSFDLSAFADFVARGRGASPRSNPPPGDLRSCSAQWDEPVARARSSFSSLSAIAEAKSRAEGSACATEPRPYRFAFFSTDLPSTIHARELAEVVSGAINLADILAAHDDHAEGAWWLDVLDASAAELAVLSRVFRLHPLTLEDIQLEETREKLEPFREYNFLVFRSFEQDRLSPQFLKPINIYIITFPCGIMSLHSRGTPAPQKVRQRIHNLRGSIDVTQNWITYALLDEIVDEFAPVVEKLAMEVDSIDDEVLMLADLDESVMLQRIGSARAAVMGLLRLMGTKADVLRALIKRSSVTSPLSPDLEISAYLYDVLDHVSTSTQNLTYYEKVLSRSHTNFLTQVSIQLTTTNSNINNLLSKLTVFGTTVIPMNVITGIWGLNVLVPGKGGTNLSWFFGIIGVFAMFAVAGIYLSWKLFIAVRR